MQTTQKHRRHCGVVTGAVLAATLFSTPDATAGPADKVYLPLVDAGESELEFRGGYVDLDAGGHETAFVLDIGRSVTSRWFTELAFEYEDGSASGGEFEAIEWENVFQLTEQGRYWLDVGLFVEYEYRLENDAADELVIGPMFQKDVGSAQVNVNVLFERQIGSGAASEIETAYAAQVKWRGVPEHEFGLQAFGEEASHRLGPALFGTFRNASGGSLSFDAAVLAGITDSAPDLSARFEIEYEWY